MTLLFNFCISLILFLRFKKNNYLEFISCAVVAFKTGGLRLRIPALQDGISLKNWQRFCSACKKLIRNRFENLRVAKFRQKSLLSLFSSYKSICSKVENQPFGISKEIKCKQFGAQQIKLPKIVTHKHDTKFTPIQVFLVDQVCFHCGSSHSQDIQF